MRAEIVQRFLGPRAVRKVGDQRGGQRDELRVIAELAEAAEIEEPRFGLAGGPFQVRHHPVARRRVALQLEIALRDAEIDELLVVPVRDLLQILECRARLGVAPRAEQDLRAAEIELVAGAFDLVLEQGELRRGDRGGVGERELVVEAHVGRGRLRPVSGRQRGAAKPRQHVVGDGRLLIGDPLVDPDRRRVLTRQLGRFARRQRRRNRDVALRLAIEDRVERAPRLRDLAEAELRETGVVPGVRRQCAYLRAQAA